MNYLNKKYFIWLLVGSSVLFYWIYVLLFPLTEKALLGYLKPISSVVSLDAVMVFLFVKWIWKCRLLYGWLVPFPNLNGTWQGIIKSNWVNPDTGETIPPIPAILTIKQSFTSISCVMRTEEMTSYSFVSGFEIDKDNQILRLVYSYNGIPKQTVRDRSSQHYGTMLFDIINNNGKRELMGDYWTGRGTVGTVELVFWKKKRLERYPKQLGKHPMSKIKT